MNVVGNTAAESDTVRYTCSVTYAGSTGPGKITPSIRWRTSEGVSITDGIITTPTGNRIDSQYTVTAGMSSIRPCQCEVFIPETVVNGSSIVKADHVAQNIPSYTESHSFEEVVVTCKLFLVATVAIFCNLCTMAHGSTDCRLLCRLSKYQVCVDRRASNLNIRYDTIRYDTIQDAILTCARKPT